jgi:hypothetical protein
MGTIVLATSGGASPMSVTLAGKGTASSLAVIEGSTNFGNVIVGNQAEQKIEIQAAGTVSTEITKVSTSGAGFSISGLSVPLTLNPGATATFSATFAPGAAGSDLGEISITSNAADSPLTISLSGQGEKQVISLSVVPTNLKFGAVAVGKSASQEVTLKNTGNVGVGISSVSISGNAFTVSGAGKGTTLSPGDSVTLVVKFDPTKQGNATGAVMVASNVSNSPAEISLSGSGGATTQAEDITTSTVGLQWNPSATANVVGYYVYRGTQSGVYSKISPAVPTTSYVDASLQGLGSAVYYYVVTAVDSSGVESGFSNEAVVTIPNQ